MNFRISLVCIKNDGTTVTTNDNNNSSEAFQDDKIDKYLQRVLIKFYQTNGVNISQFAPVAFWTIKETTSNPNLFIESGRINIK